MPQQTSRLIASGLASGVALAVLPAIPAGAVPNTKCTLSTPVQEVQSKSQLPPELLKLLPPIADIGAPFNSTDSVSDPNAPFRRLIRAGSRGADWFIWYEHGGVGYSWHAVVARVVPGNAPTVLANADTISDTLCAVTDGAFAGTVPPYPQGARAVSDF
ncbi:hypothetical protein HMPREF0591_2144 [Mycobacterium rhizamassiliense]|uniref:Uncharacterized protein n=1 Tax=Mycobacterium rhizamassiliense TaxID=1841860 RepID=A0A2U3NX84_9MYCO|nr:hypothetical protein [Mycobacterium rhizamassiliense]SPM36121.1 hypothetical protein HMPREF0591_2144 [Mycobacterium rhizamassiliense]